MSGRPGAIYVDQGGLKVNIPWLCLWGTEITGVYNTASSGFRFCKPKFSGDVMAVRGDRKGIQDKSMEVVASGLEK